MSTRGSGGGSGSTTRHIIEVMYQVTGLDKAGPGITSLNKSVQQGQTTLDKFGMSANKASQETTKLSTSAKTAAPAMDKTASSADKLDKSQQKAGKSAKGLTEFFRGNRGLIFSTTMLTSGIFEAIGMYQGWQDASEKLAQAKAKEASLLERGMEHTKEYGDAVKEVSDAQRGYNFITRFTIQSFTDLIPMSLMMGSSLLDLSSKFMEGASMKEKFAAASSKVVGGLKAIGSAMMTFTTRHPLLLLLTLLSTAIVAAITNFGGFRDRLNEVGVALGNAVPGLKGFLDWLGQLGNGFSTSAQEAMGYSEKTTESLETVEEQVLRTGDATHLSIDDQIEMFHKLGEESEQISFSLATHLKMQQDDQKTHKQRYEEFVSAIQSGDQDIQQSMGLTAEEYKKFYEEWQKEIQDFESRFSEHVDKVTENYKTFAESARESQENQGEELQKLQQKLSDHLAKFEEVKDKEGDAQDKAMDKWEQERDEIIAAINAIDEGLSEMAVNARDDWNEFSQAGKDAMESFKLEALGGNFQEAVNAITTAMDGVPDKYQQNMGQARSILENESLSMESRADIFVAHMDKLNPFQSFIVGAHEYTLAQAQLASGLDELAVAARANVTDMSQMDEAWNQFVSTLSPAQRELPIVKSAIEGVNTGAIDGATAFGMVEAAGRTMSEQLGGTVTKSFEDLEKVIVDLPGDTSAVFANIGGQIVKVGEVSDESLVTGPKSAVSSMDKVAKQSATLSNTVATEMTKSSDAVSTFQTDANSFLDGIIKTFQGLATEVQKLPGTLKTALSTDNIKTAWDGFRNALGEGGQWVNNGVNQIAGYLKGAITIDNFKQAWTGFWQAVGEGGQIITSGISTLAKTIAEDIKLKAMSQQWWKGFWEALKETGTWVAAGIGAIGTEIAKTIVTQGPSWWEGFRVGLAKTVTWVGSQVMAVGKEVATTIVKQGPAWWEGFRVGLMKIGGWVGTQIKTLGTEVAKTIVTQGPAWWEGFRVGLVKDLSWVGQQIAKVGQAILNYNWASIGQGIWKKISDAIGGAAGSITGGLGGFWDQLMKGGGKDKNPFTDISFGGGMPTGGPQQVNEWGGAVDQMAQKIAIFNKVLDGFMQKVSQVWKSLSDFSTSVSTYASSMTTALGGFLTKAGQGFAYLDTIVKAHWGTWSQLSTSISTYAGSMLAAVGKFSQTTGQAFAYLDTIVKAHWGTWSQLSTSITTYSGSMLSAVQKFSQTTGQAFAYLDQIVKAHWGTWSQLSTSISTYSGSMTASIQKFTSAANASLTQLNTTTKTVHTSFSSMSTSIATYSKSMSSSISSFASTARSSLTTLSSTVTSTTSNYTRMGTQIRSASSSALSSVKSFASGASSALRSIASAASSAVSALNRVADAARRAAAARRSAGLRFGGSFIHDPISGQSGGIFAQQGKSWINTRPRKIGGVNISEFSKPELVTVTPLSNPNNPMDKGLSFLEGLTVPKVQGLSPQQMSGGATGGGQRGQPVQVSGDVHVTLVTPNGQVLAKEVRQYLLSGFSGIT